MSLFWAINIFANISTLLFSVIIGNILRIRVIIETLLFTPLYGGFENPCHYLGKIEMFTNIGNLLYHVLVDCMMEVYATIESYFIIIRAVNDLFVEGEVVP